MIDWVVIVEKVPEVAIVLIFVWFTLKMLTLAKDFLKTRDDSYLANLQTIEGRHNEEIETLSTELREQATIMKKICDQMSALTKQMSAHTKLLKFIAEDAKKRSPSTS